MPESWASAFAPRLRLAGCVWFRLRRRLVVARKEQPLKLSRLGIYEPLFGLAAEKQSLKLVVDVLELEDSISELLNGRGMLREHCGALRVSLREGRSDERFVLRSADRVRVAHALPDTH